MPARHTRHNPHDADLTGEIIRLREEVRVLRDVLDEIREELQYAVRNGELQIHFGGLSLPPPKVNSAGKPAWRPRRIPHR